MAASSKYPSANELSAHVEFMSALSRRLVSDEHAAAAWGSYTAASKPLLRHWSALGLAFRSMAAALPFLWLVALPRFAGFSLADIEPMAWGAILYSGLLSSGLAYILWNYGIAHVGAARTAVVANLLPAVAIVVAVFTLGESIASVQVVGGSLVIAGVLWVRHESIEGQRRERERAAKLPAE